MNILYIDTFLQSMNHSNSLMPKLFKKVGNVDFYGPGYVSNRILASGINKFIELRNEYSFLVIGPNFPVFLNDKKLKYGNISEYLNWIKRYNVTASNKKIIKDFLNDILDTLNTIPIKNKILTLFLLDVYAVNNDQLNSFQEKGFYILAQDKNFVSSIDDLPNWAFKEKHFIQKRNRIKDDWLNFITQNKQKIISMHHFIDECEFNFSDIKQRTKDISIPGASYYKRAEAKRKFLSNKIKPNSNFITKMFSLGDRLRLPMFSNSFLLEFYKNTYKINLRKSKLTFTARGGFGMTVRKFFEIPASGSLLMCLPPVGFEHLGFVHNKNYILTDIDNLVENYNYFLKNVEVTQKIVDEARNLVFVNHSTSARALQIKKSLEKITKGTFKGSEWINGKYRS